MKHNFFTRFMLLSSLFFCAACGDSDSSTSVNDEDSSSSVTLSSSQKGPASAEQGRNKPAEVSSSSNKNTTSSSRSGAIGSSNSKPSSSSTKISSSSNKTTSSSSKTVIVSSSSKDTVSAEQGRSKPAEVSSSSNKNTTSSSRSEAIGSSNSKPTSSSVTQNSSEYVPFDHSKTLGSQKLTGGYKTFTDTRNGRSYYYITIASDYTGKSVTVMAENLNIGKMVPGSEDQNDDNVIERYCYGNDSTKCDEYGGLYQWAEMMQLPSHCNVDSCTNLIQKNHRGICPEGWRLFTYDDFIVVNGYKDDYNDGIKGLRSTYGFSGTNTSGFSLIGAGIRDRKGQFRELNEVAYWAYPQEHNYNKALDVHTASIAAMSDSGPSKDDLGFKVLGFSVRCVKLEE